MYYNMIKKYSNNTLIGRVEGKQKLDIDYLIGNRNKSRISFKADRTAEYS